MCSLWQGSHHIYVVIPSLSMHVKRISISLIKKECHILYYINLWKRASIDPQLWVPLSFPIFWGVHWNSQKSLYIQDEKNSSPIWSKGINTFLFKIVGPVCYCDVLPTKRETCRQFSIQA